MPKELVISAAPHETRVAILEDGLLCEIYIEREKEFALVGSIYKGRVTRVLPGMQSAFVDIGLDSDAFLYVGDFLENLEDYDHVVTPVEGKVEKMEQQGGAVFARARAGGNARAGIRRSRRLPRAESFRRSLRAEPFPRPAECPELQSPRAPESNATPASAIRRGRPLRTATRPGPAGPRAAGSRPNSAKVKDATGVMIAAATAVGDAVAAGAGAVARGNDRRPGRDLPPSKYASPRPFTPRPYEPPTEELAGRLRADYSAGRVAGEIQGPRSVSAPSRPGRDSGRSASAPVSASETASPSEFATGASADALRESPRKRRRKRSPQRRSHSGLPPSPLAPPPIEAAVEPMPSRSTRQKLTSLTKKCTERSGSCAAESNRSEHCRSIRNSPQDTPTFPTKKPVRSPNNSPKRARKRRSAEAEAAEHEHGRSTKRMLDAPESCRGDRGIRRRSARAGESEDAASRAAKPTGEGIGGGRVAEGGPAPEVPQSQPIASASPKRSPRARASPSRNARASSGPCAAADAAARQRPSPRHQDHRHQQQRAAAADFRNAEGRPGNHRADRQGAAGQEGRAHHQPRRAARAASWSTCPR